MNHLDAFKQHGDVIWNIANLLRGPYRPPQYRRVMIPLTVLRRLDCVLESTKDQVIALYKKLKADDKYDAETIEKMINRKFDLTFHNISEFTFAKLLGDPDKLAANLRNYIGGFSSRARKIIEKFKFEEEIDKLEDANRLFEVVKQVAAVDLHPNTIPNIAMGYVFEDLVRRFNEQPRVTKPYAEEQWQEILAAGHQIDERLQRGDVRLTVGGEPTFVSIDDREGAEWNTAAVGPNKRGRADDHQHKHQTLQTRDLQTPTKAADDGGDAHEAAVGVERRDGDLAERDAEVQQRSGSPRAAQANDVRHLVAGKLPVGHGRGKHAENHRHLGPDDRTCASREEGFHR